MRLGRALSLLLGVFSASAAVLVACSSDDSPSASSDAGIDAAPAETAVASPAPDVAPPTTAVNDAGTDAADASSCVPFSGGVDAAVADFALGPIPGLVDGGTYAVRIARGSDGFVWINDQNMPRLFRTNAAQGTTEVPLPAPAGSLTSGPDGALWFTEPSTGKVGRLETDGGITEFVLPSTDAGAAVPLEIAPGPDGNLWIGLFGDAVVRLTPDGVATPFDVGVDAGALLPSVLAAGPDGNLWLASAGLPLITRITPAGAVSHYPVSGASFGVTSGPDGAVWFTMRQKIGRITFEPEPTAPTIAELDVPGMQPGEIIAGPDCASLYVADSAGNRVRRFAPPPADAGADGSLSFVDFAVPTPSADVESLVVGPGGVVWFVEVQTARVGFFRP